MGRLAEISKMLNVIRGLPSGQALAVDRQPPLACAAIFAWCIIRLLPKLCF
jgi:hypothetical protein